MSEIIKSEIKSIPKNEQETICNYMADIDKWHIYSCAGKTITKLLKIFDEDEFTRVVKNKEGRVIELEIEGLEFAQVSIREKRKGMSEEQRQAKAERMRELHKAGML